MTCVARVAPPAGARWLRCCRQAPWRVQPGGRKMRVQPGGRKMRLQPGGRKMRVQPGGRKTLAHGVSHGNKAEPASPRRGGRPRCPLSFAPFVSSAASLRGLSACHAGVRAGVLRGCGCAAPWGRPSFPVVCRPRRTAAAGQKSIRGAVTGQRPGKNRSHN
jgi:hypothetical protein